MIVEELDDKIVPAYVDERGKVRNLSSFTVEGLHVVTMKPGAVRGNHIHEPKEVGLR